MNIILNIVTFLSLCVTSALAQNQDWLEGHMSTMDSIAEQPVEEQIRILGQLVRIGNEKMSDNQRAVFERAQKLLLTIPGHAEYHERRIKEAEQKVKDSLGTNEYPYNMSQYENEQMYGFQSLGQLPSPETVRVLGEFLFDDWAGSLQHLHAGRDSPMPSSSSSWALMAFGRLPLVNPPVKVPKNRADREHNLHPFRLWYQQVKAGTRTFRFEGDPQEYDLNGPVREARLPNAANARHRGEPATREAVSVKQEGVSVTTIIAVLAACGLCGGALWYAKVKA